MSPKAFLLFVLFNLFAFSHCSPAKMDFSNVKMQGDCLGKDYCFDKDAKYPKDLIEHLINKTNIKNIDSEPEDRTGEPEDLLCDADTISDPIYQIRDINNKTRYVVQTEEFQQQIDVKMCKQKGEFVENGNTEAKMLLKQFLDKMPFKGYCLQTYTNYKFLVLAEDGTRLESVRSARVPINCQCEIFSEKTNVTVL